MPCRPSSVPTTLRSPSSYRGDRRCAACANVDALPSKHKGPHHRISSSVRRVVNAGKLETILPPTMKICGACERELPDDSYSEEQRGRRQSIRRCEECVDAGKQLVLMRKGRTMSERDECLICNLPLPLDSDQTSFHPCWLHEDVVQGLQSGSHEARHDGLSILSDAHTTKREPEPRHDPKASRRGRSSGNMWSWE